MAQEKEILWFQKKKCFHDGGRIISVEATGRRFRTERRINATKSSELLEETLLKRFTFQNDNNPKYSAKTTQDTSLNVHELPSLRVKVYRTSVERSNYESHFTDTADGYL